MSRTTCNNAVKWQRPRTSPNGSMLPTSMTGLPRFVNMKLRAEAVYLRNSEVYCAKAALLLGQRRGTPLCPCRESQRSRRNHNSACGW
jgi:hypothetical protein